MSDELASLDATAQAELVRRGELTPAELVEAAIARLEKWNPELNAVIHERYERARDEAAGDLPDGPLRGVPFLMKDLGGNQAGEPYHMGMEFLKRRGWRAREDAYFTQRLRRAGLVLLGRTNTPELGALPTTEPAAYGATRNPWSREHSSGGSSGGSAAAVAAGLVPMAHASDGGGSIRIPASHCGLVGLKPTRMRASFGPQLGERWTGFSVELVVSRSVRDTAAALDATSGYAPGDPYTAPPPAGSYVESARRDPGRLRVGLMLKGPREVEIDSECAAAAQAAAELLASLGHQVEEAHPEALDHPDFPAGIVAVITCNVAAALADWSQTAGEPIGEDDVEPLTWALAEMGRKVDAPTYLGRVARLHAQTRRMAAWWESGYDLLLTPTCGAVPPPLGSFGPVDGNVLAGFGKAAQYAVFTSAFNATGQPGISLPLHWTPDGLPVGVQLVGAYGREDLLLSAAAQLEQARPWSARRPPLHA